MIKTYLFSTSCQNNIIMSADDTTTPQPRHRHIVALVRHAKIDEIPEIIKSLKAEGCGNIFLRSTRFPYRGTLVVLTEDVMDRMEGKVLYTKTVTKSGQTEPSLHDQVLEPFVLSAQDMPPADRSDRALYLSTIPSRKGDSDESEAREINQKDIRDIMNNLTRRGVIPNGSWRIHQQKNNKSSLQIRFTGEDPKQIAALARIFLLSVSHTRVQWSLT